MDKIRCITFVKKTAEKTINTVFSAEDNYPQNRKNNFVTFYNDLYIPLNSNFQNPIDKIVAYIAKIAMLYFKSISFLCPDTILKKQPIFDKFNQQDF